MPNVKIPLSALKARASRQPMPEVYLSAFKAAGTVDATDLTIDLDTYKLLNQQFPPVRLSPPPPQPAAPAPVEGSSWKELLAYTLTGDLEKDARWLMGFGARVAACCSARGKWQLAILMYPPDWSSVSAFSIWANNLHKLTPSLLPELPAPPPPPEPAPPTPAELATNFVGAVATWTAAGFPTLTQAQYDERKAVCDACPQWDATAYLGLGKCKACGCTRFKRWLFTEKCKLDLWPALTSAPAA